MKTENILMGQRQLQRWHLIKMVEGSKKLGINKNSGVEIGGTSSRKCMIFCDME